MSQQPVKVVREWPKFAVGPLGNRARFDCVGDIPVDWIIEGEDEPRNVRRSGPAVTAPAPVVSFDPMAPGPVPVKNKGGRPRKDAEAA